MLAYKLTRYSSQKGRDSKDLSHFNERRIKRDYFCNISIKTNSNLINLQEPFQLSYETKDIYKKIRQNELKIVEFNDCQYCGSLSNSEAIFCFYCGNQLSK